MLINKSNIIDNGEEIVFLNQFALDEVKELTEKILENMLSDMSILTGLDKETIFKNYLSLNEFNPIKEILKREGKYPKEEKSLVLFLLEERDKKC